MENKYYDYLKPQLPKQSFSDVVNQQLQIVQQQQQQRLAQDMLIQREQRKVQDAQQQELLGFDPSNFSDVDRQVFAAKKDWLSNRINGFYYTGSNRSEFVNDVQSLNNLYEGLENHHANTTTERTNLEGYVSGTKQWTDKTMKLGDTKESLDYKVSQWNTSGVDPNSIEFDANGDAYGYYTDINGMRMQGEDGADMFGLVAEAPTRGSKEYFSPTVSPYENLLPGAFSKTYSAGATRLKNNQNLTYDQKLTELREWVTFDAMNNPSVAATARSQFAQNYGEDVFQSYLATDQQKNGGQEGYIPMDMREYVDETMRFLEGNLMDAPTETDDKGPTVFPSSVEFKMDNFYIDPAFQMSQAYTPTFGSGISSLMVPKSGVGKSSVMVESTYTPQNNSDPRANEVSDQYKVLGVAVDASGANNLFVRAEMYVEEDISSMDPAIAAQLENYNINADGKTTNVKKVVNIVVPAVGQNGEKSAEYLSILAQIGYMAGIKEGDRRDAIAKGLETLKMFNDSEAQIFASQPTL
tara:strand:+ start:1174 stop:2745 length:1572 start_codon:yes stop_codon:yes gene_type:complete